MALSVSSVASCPSTFLSGSTPLQVNRGESKVTCKKADIHPKFYNDAKVYCNGELVMTTGGTQNEYVVDVWSGNHPFYQGNKNALLLDADRVEKFRQRYAGFSTIQEVPSGLTGDIVFEKKKKGGLKGKGGKK
jgi:large subunit ribosomal protein L31